MSNTPQVRFAGFTDAWEQRKLGEVGSCQSGIGFPDAEQGGTEGIPFFKVSDMNISGNEYELLFSNNYVTQEQIERKKWKPITEVPAMFFAKVGAAVMLNRKRLVNTPFLLDNNTMAYKFGDAWDTNFGRTLFDTINLASLVQVGALPSYNANDVEGIEIALPTLEEQKKIGDYFRNLDTLITLHQRKCDTLQKFKKSMLQKMFPQNGETVPEIRFAGFTDAWEQRKVGELCSISTGKSNTQDKIDDGIYPFYVRSPIIEKSNKYLYDEEAVITVGDGVGTGKVFHYVNGKYDLHQRCYRMYGFSDELDAKYFYHTFSLLFYKRVMAMTAKTSVDSVRLEMISDMEIPTPSIDEQLKIGQLFTNIDSIITLHQRKLETLQKMKKSLLQKMFV